MKPYFILYVRDQAASASFYRKVLLLKPRLDVPGMTEFDLDGAILGLMPEAGIQRLLGGAAPRFVPGSLRAELYLLVDDPCAFHERALAHGARELSAPAKRDWGHLAGYTLDADGHVLAFANSP